MTVYFYGRNSDIGSFERGSSVATQLSKCKSYCNIKDITIDVEVSEQVSGTVPFERRPKGFELMQKLKPQDHLVVSHICRFGRNTLDLLTMVEKFKKQKISLHIVEIGAEVTGSDAMGSVFLKLLSVFAEFYATQVSEKTKASKDRLKSQGKFLGGFKAPFGYDVDDNNFLVPCEKDQKIIREMKYLKQSGNSYKKVSEIITAKTKKKFASSWVWAILKREGVSNGLPV